MAGLELASPLRENAATYFALNEIRGWLHRLLLLVPEHGLSRFRGLRAACWLAALQGDRHAAESLLAEARQLAGEIGSPAIALVDQAAGYHQLFLGDFEGSAESLRRALDGLQPGGNPRDIAQTHGLLGVAYGFAGDLTRAVELERQSLELKRHMDDRQGVAQCLEALAWMHTREHPRRAARLRGAADTLWTLMGTSLETLPALFPLHQDSEKSAREALGPELFTASYAEGTGMDLESAIAYALEEKPAPGRATDTQPRSGPTELTKRQYQIAELLAAGLTNQDIASKLVISRRTVDTHVEHILVKLGFTSRTQVAVWVSERSTP